MTNWLASMTGVHGRSIFRHVMHAKLAHTETTLFLRNKILFTARKARLTSTDGNDMNKHTLVRVQLSSCNTAKFDYLYSLKCKHIHKEY